MIGHRKHRATAALCLGVVWLWCGCGGSDGDGGPKWNCLVMAEDCTCSLLRPGKLPRPGVEYVDRCPAAQCCLLNSQGDEATTALCECIVVADDCDARAAQSMQTKVVTTCPPPS
jgi:hypothetical protein